MTNIAFVFPGQGSQKVGMGRDFYESSPIAKEYFLKADEILSFPIKDLILSGNQEELTMTQNAQPALLIVSTIISELLKDHGIKPNLVAGHSLGEYSALVAASALSFEDALKLVRTRGELMSKSDSSNKGAMSAVLGLDGETVRQVIEQSVEVQNEVQVANYNCPGQVVISGTRDGIDLISPSLKEVGAKRILPLQVSGPFHSDLMIEASKEFNRVVNTIPFHSPQVDVYSNVTASPYRDKDEIPAGLVEQIYSSVRWEDTIQRMLQAGATTFVEVGPGNVLSGLIKKINPQVQVFSVSSVTSLEQFLNEIKI